MAVRNVAAALRLGIMKQEVFKTDTKSSLHYLDNVNNCGSTIEVLIRESFFNIVKGISTYFIHA